MSLCTRWLLLNTLGGTLRQLYAWASSDIGCAESLWDICNHVGLEMPDLVCIDLGCLEAATSFGSKIYTGFLREVHSYRTRVRAVK